MAARTSSAEGDAPAEYSPAVAGLRDHLEAWKARLAETGWTPWLILGLAAFLRFFLLGIKPPHFDEGINGWFVDQVMHNGFYRYDPTNYHGPLHFYILFVAQTLLGRHEWALRLPLALISTACVAMMPPHPIVLNTDSATKAQKFVTCAKGHRNRLSWRAYTTCRFLVSCVL